MTNKKLKIRQDKPGTVRFNKAVIWVVGAAVLLIILLIILNAFSEPSTSKKAIKLPVVTTQKAKSQSAIDALPGNYSDKAALAGYLPSNGNNAEISALREQQEALESQLRSMQSRPRASEHGDALQEQARSSAVFFPGGNPASGAEANARNVKPNPGMNNGLAPSSYEQQNMQKQKIDFMKGGAGDKDSSAIYNMHQLITPASPYEVQAGTLIPAVLLTAVNTTLPGEIVARVTQNIDDNVSGKYLLIPQGSKIIGQYDSQVSYGQRRVLIVFTRVIRPDGSSILLSKAPGADLFGQAGVKGDVDNHWGRVIGSAVLSTVLSLGTGVAADNNFTNGSNTYYRSAGQNALLGAAGNISQTGQSITDRAMNVQPTLTIPAGYGFNIIVNKDMILAPYRPAQKINVVS